MIISKELISKICKVYPLNPKGIHGLSHWARVREFGLKLAETTGADPVVVELFAVFHDSQRHNDGRDPDHGPRGAQLARLLFGEYFKVESAQLEMLCRACEGHTFGTVGTKEDITVFTCWDADRLDLLRVGNRPNPEYLCTPAARDRSIIEWACSWSSAGYETDRLKQWLALLSSKYLNLIE